MFSACKGCGLIPIHGTLNDSAAGVTTSENVECVDGIWIHICIPTETARYATPA